MLIVIAINIFQALIRLPVIIAVITATIDIISKIRNTTPVIVIIVKPIEIMGCYFVSIALT